MPEYVTYIAFLHLKYTQTVILTLEYRVLQIIKKILQFFKRNFLRKNWERMMANTCSAIQL